jgi:hypothetical protein
MVNGDTLTGTLATQATSASNIGIYAITQGSLAASPNYHLTFVTSTLTVLPWPFMGQTELESRFQWDKASQRPEILSCLQQVDREDVWFLGHCLLESRTSLGIRLDS